MLLIIRLLATINTSNININILIIIATTTDHSRLDGHGVLAAR